MRTIKTNYYRGTQQKHIFTASHNISLISLLNLIINIFRKERERAATFSLMMALQRITLAPLLLHKMHFSLLEKLFLWFFSSLTLRISSSFVFFVVVVVYSSCGKWKLIVVIFIYAFILSLALLFLCMYTTIFKRVYIVAKVKEGKRSFFVLLILLLWWCLWWSWVNGIKRKNKSWLFSEE